MTGFTDDPDVEPLHRRTVSRRRRV